jgi:hypothetical protein
MMRGKIEMTYKIRESVKLIFEFLDKNLICQANFFSIKKLRFTRQSLPFSMNFNYQNPANTRLIQPKNQTKSSQKSHPALSAPPIPE